MNKFWKWYDDLDKEHGGFRFFLFLAITTPLYAIICLAHSTLWLSLPAIAILMLIVISRMIYWRFFDGWFRK